MKTMSKEFTRVVEAIKKTDCNSPEYAELTYRYMTLCGLNEDIITRAMHDAGMPTPSHGESKRTSKTSIIRGVSKMFGFMKH